MITLITGLPGAGKTLNTLELVESEWGDSGRKIYYAGISELTLPWEMIEPEQINEWEKFDDGSIFVIDELQRVWGSRAHSKPKPPAVAALDTHRHRGFDFYFITQAPTLIDHDARKMVSRHIHVERAFGFNRSRIIEFQQCENDPRDHFAQQQAIIKNKAFNTKYFNKYKSASIHTVKRKIPKKLIIIILGMVILGGLSLNFALKMGARKLAPNDPVEADPVTYEQFYSSNSFVEDERDYISREEYLDMHTPRVSGVPHSAPIYDSVAVVKTFPRPQCVERIQFRTCSCFTQQATPLDIDYDTCMDYVHKGWFNPFIDEEAEKKREREQALAAATLVREDTQKPRKPRITYLGDSTSYPDRGTGRSFQECV